MLVRKKLQGVGLLALSLSLGLTGCSGSAGSDSSTSSSSLSTLDTLPKATSPVTSSSSSALTLENNDPQALATTGMPFGTTTASNFNSTSSKAACEMFNMGRGGVQSASKGDLILCYVQHIAADHAGSSVYNGDYHVYRLNDTQTGEHGAPSKVRLRVVRDPITSRITDFEMFACEGSDQHEYLSQVITPTTEGNSSFTMVSKGIFDENSNSGAYQTNVTGTLNSAGRFVGTKTISQTQTGTFDSNAQWGSTTVLQTDSTFTVTSAYRGSFNDSRSGCSGTFNDSIASQSQLIDGNSSTGAYNLGLLGVGDGYMTGTMSGSGTCSFGSSNWSDTFSQGWSGDTRQADATAGAAFSSAVASLTAPTADATAPTISFTGAEVYADCGSTSDIETTLSFNSDDLDAQCSDLNLSHDWIDCWHQTGNN